MQACRLNPAAGEAHGLLSWLRPGFRQRGVFAAIQAAVDTDLLAEGLTHIRSWVVDGPGAAAMAAAIVAPGGTKGGGAVPGDGEWQRRHLLRVLNFTG